MPASPPVIDVPLGAPCVPGRLDPANARHVLALLDLAIDGCTRGEFAAMVTAPVQKSIINGTLVCRSPATPNISPPAHARRCR